jgi:RNA polymerase sigma factor (sigma-70 family)
MLQNCDQPGLLAQARRGHSGAFDALCQPHTRRLLRNTYRITRNREDAEDALQDSFMKAFVHINKFDGRSAFSTWLTRIAINSALMIIRKRRSSRLIDMGIPGEPGADEFEWDVTDQAANRSSVTPNVRSRIFLHRRSALYVQRSERLLRCARYRKCRQGKRREGSGFR